MFVKSRNLCRDFSSLSIQRTSQPLGTENNPFGQRRINYGAAIAPSDRTQNHIRSMKIMFRSARLIAIVNEEMVNSLLVKYISESFAFNHIHTKVTRYRFQIKSTRICLVVEIVLLFTIKTYCVVSFSVIIYT